jgi:hypothetical protein
MTPSEIRAQIYQLLHIWGIEFFGEAGRIKRKELKKILAQYVESVNESNKKVDGIIQSLPEVAPIVDTKPKASEWKPYQG